MFTYLAVELGLKGYVFDTWNAVQSLRNCKIKEKNREYDKKLRHE